jgi:hypothetical protein
MKRRSPLLALSLVAAVAAPALAGGFACTFELAESKLVQSEHGNVSLTATLTRGPFDCGGTGFVACDPKLPGPLVTVERLASKDTWVQVKAPWLAFEGGDRDAKVPYRLDWDDRIGFARRAKLKPGTYRLRCGIRIPRLDWTYPATSKPFVVSAKPSTKKVSWLGRLFGD